MWYLPFPPTVTTNVLVVPSVATLLTNKDVEVTLPDTFVFATFKIPPSMVTSPVKP